MTAELTRIQRGKCHANSLDNFLSLRQPRAANLKCAGARNGLRDLPGLVRAREETPTGAGGLVRLDSDGDWLLREVDCSCCAVEVVLVVSVPRFEYASERLVTDDSVRHFVQR